MGEVYRQVFGPVREFFDTSEKIELSSAPASNDVSASCTENAR